MNYKTLAIHQDKRGVLTIALNRPEVRNAFNDSVISELAQVFKDEVMQNSVRAVVLRGNGSVFCAGGDLNWMKSAVEQSYEENLSETRKLAQMFYALNTCPKPVIGLIHGAAIGGGVGLVSVCDIAIAVEDTQFSLSEVRLGIVPACIGPFVVSKIGPSHARGLFMSADRFSGVRAKEIGLIHETVSHESKLEESAERVLKNILQCGPHAMLVAKQLVHDLSWFENRMKIDDSLEHVAKILADIRITKEGQEGVRAFLEKRKPSWL